MTNIQYIQAQVTAPQKGIEATLQLLGEDLHHTLYCPLP